MHTFQVSAVSCVYKVEMEADSILKLCFWNIIYVFLLLTNNCFHELQKKLLTNIPKILVVKKQQQLYTNIDISPVRTIKKKE